LQTTVVQEHTVKKKNKFQLKVKVIKISSGKQQQQRNKQTIITHKNYNKQGHCSQSLQAHCLKKVEQRYNGKYETALSKFGPKNKKSRQTSASHLAATEILQEKNITRAKSRISRKLMKPSGTIRQDNLSHWDKNYHVGCPITQSL
jgi:hypothetical protein